MRMSWEALLVGLGYSSAAETLDLMCANTAEAEHHLQATCSLAATWPPRKAENEV